MANVRIPAALVVGSLLRGLHRHGHEPSPRSAGQSAVTLRGRYDFGETHFTKHGVVRTLGLVHGRFGDEDRLCRIFTTAERHVRDALRFAVPALSGLHGLAGIVYRLRLDLKRNLVAPLRQALQQPEAYLHPIRLGAGLFEIFDRPVVDVPGNAEPPAQETTLRLIRIDPDLPGFEPCTFAVRAIDKRRRAGW